MEPKNTHHSSLASFAPQYDLRPDQQSTCCVTSTATQVPMPHGHFVQDYGQCHAQDFSFGVQIGSLGPWETPDMPSPASFDCPRGSSRQLNPESSTYVPTGKTPIFPPPSSTFQNHQSSLPTDPASQLSPLRIQFAASPVNPEEMRRRSASPKSLLAAGGININTLDTITESYVYGAGTQGRSFNTFPGPAAVFSPSNQAINDHSAMGLMPQPVMPPMGLLGAPQGMSAALRNLTRGGTCKPTIQEALDSKYLPFAEYCRLAKVDTFGVVKIKNIPYSVNRAEVMAFLGRNAKMVNETNHEPVHIIMERVTSKTLDCYVEFINFNEAVSAVNRFETNKTGGRGGRLGQRHVEVELSSQDQLMKDLFPKAKNVRWVGGRPEIIPRDPNDKYNSGFQGFVSKEELVMLVKHVEAPQRSPFSQNCLQRPFECLISTLLKYPWYMVDHITLEDRSNLHQNTMHLLGLLVERVRNEQDNINLTPMLLKRVWRAALKCPGFSPAMKDDVVFICGLDDMIATEHGVPLFAPHWKYVSTIGPKPGAPADLVLWYIATIRETTEQELSLADQAARGEVDEPKLFGDLDKHIKYDPGKFHQPLSQVARAEWVGIEKILRRALAPTSGY